MKRIGEETVVAFSDVRRRLNSLANGDASIESCVNGLGHLERCLARRPRVVVVGEANSGKTSLINSLTGEQMLPTGVLSNTPVPVRLRHGDRHSISAVTSRGKICVEGADALGDLFGCQLKRVDVSLPNPLLMNFDIVDTPSDADVLRSVGDADVVLWCTLAPRAWMETERQAWSKVSYRCKQNSILVATHADGMADTEERDKVAARLRSCTKGLFEKVLFVSSLGDESRVAAAQLIGEGATEEACDQAVLLGEIEVLAARVMRRRVRAAKRIAERLARVAYGNVEMGAQDEANPMSPISGRWLSQWERLLATAADSAKPVVKPAAGEVQSVGVRQAVSNVAA